MRALSVSLLSGLRAHGMTAQLPVVVRDGNIVAPLCSDFVFVSDIFVLFDCRCCHSTVFESSQPRRGRCSGVHWVHAFEKNRAQCESESVQAFAFLLSDSFQLLLVMFACKFLAHPAWL